MWHCPHCGAPQAETARCWVCRRSSTTCSTCRHFRRSLAADVGWCALDRARKPLTGLELRGCWQARLVAGEGQPNSVTSVGARAAAAHVDPDALPTRDFVPVELVGPLRLRTLPVVSANQAGTEPGPEPAAVPLPIVTGDADPGWTERTSLFGDLDS